MTLQPTLIQRLKRLWPAGTSAAEDAADRASSAGPASASSDGADPALAPWAHKVCSAADAVGHVRPGDHVFVGTACATPRALLAALQAREPVPQGVELLHFLTDQALAHDDATGAPLTHYRHRTFFVGQDMRAAVRAGMADYVPISLAQVPGLMAIGRIPVDVALVQVSLPDTYGYVSLGISVDIAPAALAAARLVVAEVNPAMPRTMGESMVHVDAIHHLVPVAPSLIEYRHPEQPGPVVERIARYVSSIIDDGSTLQIGLGRFSNEALKHLTDRRDLGIHCDVLTDAVIPLLERGIVTGARKSRHRGRIVASFAMGTERLYALLDRNPLFSFQPIDAVCDAATLAAQHRLVSVTQAFAVDLTGQVCADQMDGDFYGGVACQADFMQGAARSPGGKPIVCLASTEADGSTSRIRAVLAEGQGVTIARSDVHYVVTEYGVAYLYGKSIRERAVALIQIAHPDARQALLDAAKARGWLPAEQPLRNLAAYSVEDEQRVQLADGREVLLRPAGASDGDAVRALFHQMPAGDVYTRFFRRIRGLSTADVQRLCNVNFETEVAFVAVAGPREQPDVVGHAMYVLDPSTNLAETAFISHPGWQHVGLGAALQRQLGALARRRGVRGFVAEVRSTNTAMIQLAQQAEGAARTEDEGGTTRITTLF